MALKYRDKPDALMVDTSNHTKSKRADSDAFAPVSMRLGRSVLEVHGNLYALGTSVLL